MTSWGRVEQRLSVVAGVTFLCLGAAAGHAQAKFDVASVRQNKVGGPQQSGATADGYRATNMPLLLPILTAYVPQAGGDAAYFTNDRVRGAPDWARTERYDIDAKVSEADLVEWRKPEAQTTMLRALLQALLEERCKLEVHRETADVPVYSLVVGKNGPKINEAKTGEAHPGGVPLPGGAVLVPGNGGQTLNFYGASMVALAQVLTNLAGRPVQDKTGLAGKYDFAIDKGSVGPPTAEQGPAPPSDSGPSILTVVQEQLGLKLEPRKGLVETLVVDHMERPSEN
jgi:bla regulator protein BlaR1